MFNVGDLIKVAGDTVAVVGLIDSISEGLYDCTIVKATAMGADVDVGEHFYVPSSAAGLSRILTADEVEYALEYLS